MASEWHSSTAWKKARAHAKTLLDPVCAVCGKELHGWDWTIDHIIPPGDGDKDFKHFLPCEHDCYE